MHYLPGDAAKPLVVFVPGAHHTARIAYGHPGSRSEDFLAHWVQEEGYGFLGISYPILPENPVMITVDPGFTVREWGAQAAAITRQIIDENGLSNQVIVLGWSMAGKIAHAFNVAAENEGLVTEFYISLSATPPLHGLIDGWERIKPAPTGLADRRYNYERWYSGIDEMNRMNGRTAISEDRYMTDYVGYIPVNIQGYPLRYRDGEFVIDQMEGLDDYGTFDFRGFPLVAMMLPDMVGDARHALTDLGTWSPFIVAKIYQSYLTDMGVSPRDLPPGQWQALINVVNEAPKRLSVAVHGNHFFFVGEQGARQTARNIGLLEQRVATLKSELATLTGAAIQ